MAAVALAGVAAASTSADQTLARSQALMARGEYRLALGVLEPLADAAALTALQRARVHQQLAAVRSQIGPDDDALAEADRAERDARAVDAFDLLARIESVRGIVWLNRGRSVESLRHFRTCAEWAERSRQPPLVAGAYIRLAAAYQDLGDWTRALDAVNRSAEADPHPEDSARVQYLARRGLVEVELHEGEAAKSHTREALGLTRRIGDRRGECQVLIDLALVTGRIDRDPAQAVSIARQLRMSSLEIPALNELGSLLRLSGKLAQSRDRLTEALDVIARASEHRDEPYVLKNLGQTLIRLGRADEGADVLRRAAERADAVSLTRVRWLARLELAQLDATQDPAAADREFSEVLSILEQQQTNVLLEGFRAGALDQTLAEYDPYDRYVSFLLDRGQPARAFQVAERERARVFLDTLSGARDELAQSLPAGFRDHEDAILRRISASQSALRTATMGDSRRRDLLMAVARDEAGLTALRLRLAVERPALADARYPAIWSVSDLQSKLLRPDEALAGFFLGVDRSVCWVITSGAFATIPLPARGEIETRVRAALQEIRNPMAHDDRAVAALARTLAIGRLTEIAGGSGGRHLVIVPHGILYDVPFEALPGDGGRPLVERFAVSCAPSASALVFFRSLPPTSADAVTLLAVGNPIVRDNTTKAARAGNGQRQVDLASVDLLTPLPYSADEIKQIAELFKPRVRVLEAADATKGGLRASGLERVRMVHFATHGLIDEIRPERSGLVLTSGSRDDDGLLQAREIYSLRLRADLVTLSACQTALGRNVTGEGIIGLTRAFFYAGARAVVASLWDIEDASTSRLMQRFYTNIRNGEPLDVALQDAKIAFIRGGGATSRPFYWASFIVSGQGRAVVDVPGRGATPRGQIAAGVIAAAIAVLAVQWWWRRPWRTTVSGTAR